MSVTPYARLNRDRDSRFEELLRNQQSVGRHTGQSNPNQNAYVGGMNPSISRPRNRIRETLTGFGQNAARNVQNRQRSGGGLDILGAARRFGQSAVDNVRNRIDPPQKVERDAFADIDAQQRIDELFASMPGAFSGDPLSFLSRAQQAIGDGGLSEALAAIEAREQNYQQQAKQGDARLAAMYDQLRNSILNDSETVSGITDQAQERLSNVADREQEAISSAHQATQDRQNEILGRLGIEDAQAIGLAQGDVQGRLGAEQLERAATRDAAAQQRATEVGQNAQNFNTSNAAAAGLEGTSRRADLQTQLQAALARLQDEQASTRGEYANRNLNMALGLAGQMYDAARASHQDQQSNWWRRFEAEQQMRNRGFDEEMRLRELEQLAREMEAEANAPDPGLPFQHQNPFMQLQQQAEQGLGRNTAAQAINTLSGGVTTRRGGEPRFNSMDDIIQELVDGGVPLPWAQNLAYQYGSNLGMF